MTLHRLVSLLLAATLAAATSAPTHRQASAGGSVTTASVYYNSSSGAYSLRDGYDPTAAAWGSFDDALATTGWGVLDVVSNRKYADNVAMFAAGYLEGALTQQRIFENANNMWSYFFKTSQPPANVLDFLAKQDAWTRNQIATQTSSDLWIQTGLLMAQFDGLVAGYNDHHTVGQNLTLFHFQLLNDVGDFLDLLSALGHGEDWKQMSPADFARYVNKRSLCSALVKITGDFNDLFAAHSSWFTYGAMNRIYKHYHFDLNAPSTAARRVSFSSYPGFLESLDDFYVMDSGLTMIQTTNSIYDDSLYKLVVPEALFAWQRVRIANTMAKTGEDWYNIVKQYNSGTYNNQYMIVNYNLYTPGQPLLPGTLWVCEQIPGYVAGGDITRELERGYFPSYNVPYFIDIYNMSGYPAIVAKYGPDYSYQLAPRATIFRRDQATVVNLDSFKHIMRDNDFQTDPYSKGSPWNAICSRGDLASPGASAGGCYDTKVTNYAMQKQMQAHALNGPTAQNQTPFSWTAQFASTRHDGQPTTFNFPFLPVQPKQF